MPRLPNIEERTGRARARSGRFKAAQTCDFCGKPITGQHLSDDAACGGTDGPGFYLCDRLRCMTARTRLLDQKGPEALRRAYEKGRQRNGHAQNGP